MHAGSLYPLIGDTKVTVGPTFNTTCAQGHFITSWQLAAVHTGLNILGPAGGTVNTFLGYISAKCDHGLQLMSAEFSYNADYSCSVGKTGATLDPIQDVTNRSGFSGIDYRHAICFTSSSYHIAWSLLVSLGVQVGHCIASMSPVA